MLELSARLVKTLSDYGVKGEVTAIRPGPVVTMYELAPAPGTRVAKIANLADDLAMALEAVRVRIVAPIPGKAVVGIEVKLVAELHEVYGMGASGTPTERARAYLASWATRRGVSRVDGGLLLVAGSPLDRAGAKTVQHPPDSHHRCGWAERCIKS